MIQRCILTLVAAVLAAFSFSAWGQNSFPTPGGATAPGMVTMCDNGSQLFVPCGVNSASGIPALNFGIYGDGRDDTIGMNAAIDYINTHQYSCILLPSGVIGISAPLHVITGADWCIEGAGSGATTLQMSTAAGTQGTFFTIGADTGTQTARGHIGNFLLTYVNSPNGTQYPIEIPNAADVSVHDIRMLFAPSAVRVGGLTGKSSRINLLNISGSINASLSTSWFSIVRAANVYLFHPVFNSYIGGVGSGAYVSIAPNAPGGNGTDTIVIQNGNFQDTLGNTANGIVLDHSNGQLVNVWIDGGSYDHTHSASVNIISGNPGGGFLRYVRFTSVRGVPDDGQAIAINNAGTQFEDFVEFANCNFEYLATAGATITGNLNGFGFLGGSLIQQNNTNHITAAMQIGVPRFRVVGVRFGRRNGGTSNTDYAVQTTADVDNFSIIGNTGIENLNNSVILNFAYAAYSPQRITLGNTDNGDLTLIPSISNDLSLVPSRSANVALASTYTNATTSYTNTNLSLNLAANTTYRINSVLSGSNNTASSGAQFTVTAPTGSTVTVYARGQGAATNATNAGLLASSGSNSPTFWANTTGGTPGWVLLDGTITTGGTAGALTVQGKAVTSGTLTVNAGSYLSGTLVGAVQ